MTLNEKRTVKIATLLLSFLLMLFVVASTEISTPIDSDVDPNYGDIRSDSSDKYFQKFKVKLQKNCKKCRAILHESKARGEEDLKRVPEKKRGVIPVKNENTNEDNDYKGSIYDTKSESILLQSLSERKKIDEQLNWKHSIETGSSSMNSLNDRRENRFKRETYPRFQLRNENITNYYAQRKAVMDKFYARQQEIKNKYANRKNNLHPNALPSANASVKNYTDTTTVDNLPPKLRTIVIRANRDNFQNENEKIWGQCQGSLVYQHNLLLNVKGGSTDLDTRFKVSVDDETCVTCVIIQRTGGITTEVELKFDGPRDLEVRLKLAGSYKIKLWGEQKIGNNCRKIDGY